MKSRKWKRHIKRLIANGYEPCVVDFRNKRVTNLRDGSVEEFTTDTIKYKSKAGETK